MSNGVSISVMICTRDRPAMLERCLDSLSRGTILPLEVLVVDQGVGDAGRRVVDEVGARSPLHLRYLAMEDVGHTKARNAGIKASRGDIVAFTDDDCVADENWIATIEREFQDPHVSCVCGSTRPLDHANRPKQALLSTLECKHKRKMSGRRNPVTIGRGNNMAVKRHALITLGGFNEQIGVGTRLYAGDDMDLFYRLLRSSRIIVQSPDVVVYHSQPDDWAMVVQKKRGYAISVSALLSSRAVRGDIYAGLLLAGKMAYELVYLMCGGALRANRRLAIIGCHSIMGSLSGLRHIGNVDLREEIRRLSRRGNRAPLREKDVASLPTEEQIPID